jgi:formate dehydrogenase subunit delta
MSPDKLVYMANQIGKFFTAEREETAVDNIETHIKKFWEPRMRKAIAAHLEAGGAGLDPMVKKAVERIRDRLVAQNPS